MIKRVQSHQSVLETFCFIDASVTSGHDACSSCLNESLGVDQSAQALRSTSRQYLSESPVALRVDKHTLIQINSRRSWYRPTDPPPPPRYLLELLQLLLFDRSSPVPSPGCLNSSMRGRRKQEHVSPSASLQSRSVVPARTQFTTLLDFTFHTLLIQTVVVL